MKQTMRGRICMVTGATSGMGLVTAKALAKKGATVINVGRNQKKCAHVVDEIKAETDNDQIDYLVADLAHQADICRLAKEFNQKYSHLHVLVNNAGGFFLNREVTPDNIEKTLATNHLNYFLLTKLLLPIIKKSAPARIINVSSAEHLKSKCDLTNLQGEKGYNCLEAYATSKLANIVFTYELARRLEGTGVTVNALHPGWVATNIGKNNTWYGKLIVPIVQLGAVTPEEGAQTTIYLATSPKVAKTTGKYFDKGKIAQSSKQSYDPELAKKIWEISERLTRNKFSL